jgi:hypothetical protein
MEQRAKASAQDAAELAQAAYEAERELVAALRAESTLQAELLKGEAAAKEAAEAEAAEILKILEDTKRVRGFGGEGVEGWGWATSGLAFR